MEDSIFPIEYYSKCLNRHDPLLVEVVLELGKDVNDGHCTYLQIDKIPIESMNCYI